MQVDIEAVNVKRGYLKGDFEYFHLKDRKHMQFESHHHDFNKIVIMISGKASYYIEGRAYRLQPWDILLVNSMEVHKTEVEPEEIYERIVIWSNPLFLEKHSTAECNLQTCFNLAAADGRNLLRLDGEGTGSVRGLIGQLEEADKSNGFGSRILKNALFIQFIVQLNRVFLERRGSTSSGDTTIDRNINEVLKYINANLTGDLSIGALSAGFYMSRYYLMHRFKEYTGYSIHNYILQKRLIHANSLLKQGKPAVEISLECGFGDYSTFVRAFKKMYGFSPRQHYRNIQQLQKQYSEEGHFAGPPSPPSGKAAGRSPGPHP